MIPKAVTYLVKSTMTELSFCVVLIIERYIPDAVLSGFILPCDKQGPGGGDPYESDGDARRKIRINTLKETNLGVAPALFNP